MPTWVEFEERNCFMVFFGDESIWGLNPDVHHLEEGVPLSIGDLYRVDGAAILS